MPTGYTAAVQSGEITEFRDFALRCARAFGACIMLRDESLDAPIPERGEPDTRYHDEALATATKRLAELRAMGPGEAERAATAAYQDLVSAYKDRLAQRLEYRRRYEAMLSLVREWEPPSDDHHELKKFMVEQLTTSICHDTDGSYDLPPEAMTAQDWLREELRKIEWQVNYHTEKRGEEIARTARRNQWTATLRHSLDASR
jgi:hypothetical protein